jgi:8-oxo-dGTP pyrophosphatase MutT (NUDIX family)
MTESTLPNKFGFNRLRTGFVPEIINMGPLFPEWVQSAYDSRWKQNNPGGENGNAYASVVTDDATKVSLYGTSYGVRCMRRTVLEISVKDLEMDSEQFNEAYRELKEHIRKLPGEITVDIQLQDNILAVKFDFKTVNITSVGVSRRQRYAVAWHHRRNGPFTAGGILNRLNMREHAEDEINEETGLRARNLQIVGIVRDERSTHYVGVTQVPFKWICRLLFKLRKDPDNEMDKVLFFETDTVSSKLAKYNKKWKYLGAALEAALDMDM